MRIGEDGNVGIGTSSPSHLLEISGTTPTFRIENTGGINNYLDINYGSKNTNDISFTSRRGGSGSGFVFGTEPGGSYSALMKITSGGNVGIGTTSPAEQLHVHHDSTDNYIQMTVGNTTSSNNIQFGDSGGNNRGKISYANTGDSMRFYTNGASNERMRIDSSGNILHGCTAFTGGSTVGVKTNKDGVYISKTTTAIQHCVTFYNPNGEVGNIKTTGTSTQFNTSSDARLKDVKGSARGLEVINALNPVAFNWTTDGKSDEGLLAQEVQEIVPNAVSGSEETQYYMDYSKLVTHLVAGMKEQQTLIEQLQAEVALLKGE